MEQVGKTIQTANLDGSGRTTLLTLGENPWDITLDPVDRKIYWTQSSGPRRANFDGSNVEVFPALSAMNKGIAVDVVGRKLYLLELSATDALWMANLDGTGLTKLLDFDRNAWDVAVDPVGRKVYWTHSDAVRRANLDGTGAETLWQPGAIGLKGIAVDPIHQRFYVLEQSTTDALWTGNLDGSGLTKLMSLDSNPWDIAVEPAGGKIYWTQSDKVLRANLDGSLVQTLWATSPTAMKGIAVIPEPTTLPLVVLGILSVSTFLARRPEF